MAPDEIARRLDHLEAIVEASETRRQAQAQELRDRQDRQYKVVLWALSAVVVPGIVFIAHLHTRVHHIEGSRYTAQHAKEDRERIPQIIERSLAPLRSDIRELRKSIEGANRK